MQASFSTRWFFSKRRWALLHFALSDRAITSVQTGRQQSVYLMLPGKRVIALAALLARNDLTGQNAPLHRRDALVNSDQNSMRVRRLISIGRACERFLGSCMEDGPPSRAAASVRFR